LKRIAAPGLPEFAFKDDMDGLKPDNVAAPPLMV
jgi:hypothetical protein